MLLRYARSLANPYIIPVTFRDLNVPDESKETTADASGAEDGKVDGKQNSHSQASKTQSRSKRRRRSQDDISSVEVLEVVAGRLWKKLSQTALGQGVHKVSSSALPDITPRGFLIVEFSNSQHAS